MDNKTLIKVNIPMTGHLRKLYQSQEITKIYQNRIKFNIVSSFELLCGLTKSLHFVLDEIVFTCNWNHFLFITTSIKKSFSMS